MIELRSFRLRLILRAIIKPGLGLALLVLTQPLTAAIPSDYDGSEDQDVSYEVIVKNLNRQVDSSNEAAVKAKAPKLQVSDPFENIWIHAGVGYATATQTLSFEDGNKSYLNLKGLQAQVGIDLFSENWMSEGTVRSFADSEDTTSQVSLKEFELKIFYKDHINRNLGFRVGGGVSGRYMTIQRRGAEALSYTTPSSVATGGLDWYLTERLSLGAELSLRTSMISDTLDRGSLDGTVRLDAHF